MINKKEIISLLLLKTVEPLLKNNLELIKCDAGRPAGITFNRVELQKEQDILKEGIEWLSEQLSLEKMKEAKEDWEKSLEVALRLLHSETDRSNQCIYKESCGMFSSKERKDEAKKNDHCIFYAGFGKFCPEGKDLHDNNGFCISAGRYCRVPFCNTREV